MMAVEVETPEDYMGDVMGDLNRRRGIVQGMDDDGIGGKKIKPKFRWPRCSVTRTVALDVARVAPPTDGVRTTLKRRATLPTP